jgi:hypothetical protein
MFWIVLWINRRQSVSDHREVRLRFANRNPWLQMTEQKPIRREPVHSRLRRAVRFVRYPHVRVTPSKARRHDPNQGPRSSVQNKSRVQDFRIGAKPVHPGLVAHHEDRRRSRLVVGRLHGPPQHRRHTKKFEGARGYQTAAEAFGAFSRCVQEVLAVIGDDPVEHVVLLNVIEKLGSRVPRAPPGFAAIIVVNLYRHEAARVQIWKRLHQHVIDHTEDRRGGADAQRQRDHRHRRKPTALPQRSRCVTNVLPERLHGRASLHNLRQREPRLRYLPLRDFLGKGSERTGTARLTDSDAHSCAGVA